MLPKSLHLLTIKNLLILGLLLRLILITLDFSIDVNNHIAWGKETSLHGFLGFYERTGYETFTTKYPNYPPLIMYIFTVGYILYNGLFSVIWWINLHVPAFPSGIITFLEGRNVMAAFMKIPGIIGDLGVAYLLYLFTIKITQKKQLAIWSMIPVLFNPVFFYTSSLWGQVDVLPIMFFLWSLYVLLYKPQKVWSGILFAGALLSKQTVFIYIPIYFFIVLKTVKPSQSIKIFGAAVTLFWLSFLPFYQSGNMLLFPFKIYLEKILFVSGIPFISNHAFNFWALVSGWNDIPDTNLLFGIQYKIWGYCIAAVLLIIIFTKYLKSSNVLRNILFVLLMWDFTVFQFFTRMHERHFLPVLIFLIPLIWRSKRMKYIFYILSLFHMVNLYHNWAVPGVESIVRIIRSSIIENSFILIGVVIYFILLKGFFPRSTIPV